jgi:hypothetical protein
MNGPIVYNIALVLFGNAHILENETPSDLWDRSFNQFCKEVSFVSFKKTVLGKAKEVVVSPSIKEWFELMKRKNYRLRLWHQGSGRVDERFTAGFIDGGWNWNIVASNGRMSEVWTAQWNVWNQNDPEKRIWKVKYGLVGNGSPLQNSGKEPIGRLVAALRNIEDFALRENCHSFAKLFGNSIETIESKGERRFGYHKDLIPSCYLGSEAEYLLDACQSAWVFGGMGSWNDLGFSGKAQEEYENVSEELYLSLIDSIVHIVNDVRPTKFST